MTWIRERLPLIIVILVLAVILIGLTLSGQIAQNTSTFGNTQPVLEAVSAPAIGQTVESIAPEPNSKRQAENEKRQLEIADHKAQIRMARYALFAVILGMFGSGLLYWTLR